MTAFARTAVVFTLRLLAVVAPLLLLGCASMPAGVAERLGWIMPTEKVGDLNYQQIANLGVLETPGCAALAQAHQEGKRLRIDRHEQHLLECDAVVAERQAELAYERKMNQLVASAWARAMEQKAAEQARREEEREKQRQAAARARAQQKKKAKEQEQQELPAPRPMPQDSEIFAALASISDRPLAYTIGQPSEHSLKTFMACLEREYPNQGYRLDRQDKRLTIIADKAQMVRGEVPIEVRVVQVWDHWMLESLKVANVRASAAQDRFKLAQSLLSPDCIDLAEMRSSLEQAEMEQQDGPDSQ